MIQFNEVSYLNLFVLRIRKSVQLLVLVICEFYFIYLPLILLCSYLYTAIASVLFVLVEGIRAAVWQSFAEIVGSISLLFTTIDR